MTKKVDKELVELNRQLAAIVNSHVHHDTKDFSTVDKVVAIADKKEEIEQTINVNEHFEDEITRLFNKNK